MRFRLGPIPDEFKPDSSWKPIREPGPLVQQLLALPVGGILVVAVWYSWQAVGFPPSLAFDDYMEHPHPVIMLICFVLLIAVHELIHALVHPKFGCSPASTIGAWPKKMVFYAHYHGPRARNRMALGLIMPFFVLSVLPVVLAAFKMLPQSLAMWVPLLSLLNALASCGDCLGFVWLLVAVPHSAIVQNKSWRTYWKKAGHSDGSLISSLAG